MEVSFLLPYFDIAVKRCSVVTTKGYWLVCQDSTASALPHCDWGTRIPRHHNKLGKQLGCLNLETSSLQMLNSTHKNSTHQNFYQIITHQNFTHQNNSFYSDIMILYTQSTGCFTTHPQGYYRIPRMGTHFTPKAFNLF